MGLLSKFGQSETSPELFKTGNEKTLRRLLSGDGNCTCNKGFRAEHDKQGETEHRCLSTNEDMKKQGQAGPPVAPTTSQN